MLTLKPIRIAVLSAALGLAAFAGRALAADTYKLDPAHSFVIFKIQHMGAGNVWGRFNSPAGTVVLDADDAKSSINLTIKVAEIDTANKQRDEHLKTADFFNAEQFPTITFVSKSIKKLDDKTWEVTGDLTIKGTTKPLTVKLEKVGEAKDMQGKAVIGLETTFTIKRADFGVDALPQGVGADATLTVSIEADKVDQNEWGLPGVMAGAWRAGASSMDRPTIFINVVLPALVTAALLLLAWRPWNRAAQPARWQFVLSAAALSWPWLIAAGNRGNASLHPSEWIFRPWTPGDTFRWFLDFGAAVSLLAVLLALFAPARGKGQAPLRRPRAGGLVFPALNFFVIAAVGALIAWLMHRGMLAQAPLEGDSDDEISKLAARQASIHVSIFAVPLLAAGWSLVADGLNDRGKSILVPAILALVALASMLIVFLAGSATLMLLLGALAAMMIATTVMACISVPAILPRGQVAAFFLIWSTILIYTRHNQAELLPDYFWLLMLTPAGLLAALAVWSLRPWLRLAVAAAVTLTPPLIILWQLYPSWQTKMAGAMN